MNAAAPRRRPTIALCMIVKNEERYLRGCLESARPYVDEIVVVDTGSTDATVSIAEEFGAVVRHFAWNGNFSDARNESLRNASSEWVLYLDADERLLTGEALRAIEPPKNAGAYNVSIRSRHILPSGVVDQVNQYQRFFRRSPSVRFEGMVHEQVMPSVLRSGKSILPSAVVIEHLGYGESLEKIMQKCDRNAGLLRRQLASNPDDHYARYQLGNTLGVMQRYDEAEPHLLTAVEKDRNASIRASACNILVEVAMHRQDLAAAESWCRRSIALVPDQVMAYWFLSGILAFRHRFAEGIDLLATIRKQSGKETGLAHDMALTEPELQQRAALCFEGLTNEAMAAKDMAGVQAAVGAAEAYGIRTVKLQTAGAQSAMALNDLRAAAGRIDYVIEHLPEDAAGQKERFRAVKKRIEALEAV